MQHTATFAGQGTPEGELLAAEFSKFVNEAGVQAPTLQGRSPTHLMPPTAVIAAQLDALQCNDWPETDAGIRTAFQFSKPYEAEKLLRGQSQSGLVHSWQGVEPWVNFESFAAALNSAPFRILLGCERWQPISQLLFPSSRYGNKAVQAVEVIAKAEEPAASRQASTKQQRRYTFTFCLERVDEGSYKGCWMTVGLRVGDYASV
ncbi:hypothetical protein WJX72_012116 [[Myrmecia] bisecta]|uniref:Uncharacterized protein n=1 Tax=[Myrmecia] bisecta TaxID=41462 RepID=A0AAW1QUA0_9CHLO